MKPLVSICMITYNHEKYIKQAIESVIMQRTNFTYELVIGEDCSTDGTLSICQERQSQHRQTIRLRPRPKNLGIIPNFLQTLQECAGQYVALCEGDDYWISPDKLQKQVDFLERHPDCASCFHGVNVFNQETGRSEPYTSGYSGRRTVYTLDDILEHGAFPATCSLMMRNGIFADLPEWFHEVTQGDFVVHVLNGLHGTLGFLDETMAVYRVHRGGVCGGAQENAVLEKNVQEYLRIGKYLQLKQRPSYRMGLYKQSCGLLYRYLAEHAYRNAWHLLPLVLTYAPSFRLKIRIAVDLLHAWLLTYYCRLRIRTLNILKYYSGENGYRQLKWLYHVIGNLFLRK